MPSSDEILSRKNILVEDDRTGTSRETLQRALGYGRSVSDVARSELWAFSWPGSIDARGILERLARETNLLLNPNKHFMEMANTMFFFVL